MFIVESWIANIDQKPGLTKPVHILEVDKGALLSVTDSEGSFAWPASFPRVDAVLLCYDASQKTSYDNVIKLLGTLASTATSFCSPLPFRLTTLASA